jgi:uncharacterized membrane protein
MLLLALLATLIGLGLMAASMPRHWRQLRPGASCRAVVVVALRVCGAAALILALALCLRRDHPSMAVLVWIMLLAVDAVAIAMWLSTRSTPDRV